MYQTKRQILSQRSKAMKESMAPAERKLWFQFLRIYPISFVAQKVIEPYILDFYCRKARLSIELDGDSHYTEQQQDYDATRTIFLEIREIKELRFTNNDIYENFTGVCEIIDHEVSLRLNNTMGDAFNRLLAKK